MNKKIPALLIIVLLFAVQAACNFPTLAGRSSTLPAPNQTLTALFAVTPVAENVTPTLPPVATATSAGVALQTATPDANAGGGVIAPPATAQPTQTLTSAPPTATTVAATPTVPSARTRAMVVANYMATAPTLDGDWSEWKAITKEYPANNVVWGKENWANTEDLSASFHAGWDNNYLYIAVKVRDNRYVQNASGANLYEGDSLEIMFDRDLQSDYYYTKLSPDDFQLGISPGRPDVNGTREAYRWLPSNIAGAQTGVKIASVQETGVYRVEAAIPWSALETKPVNGMHYGFAIGVNDNDDPSQNVQQKMVSNVAGYRLVDPTTWGDLKLVK